MKIVMIGDSNVGKTTFMMSTYGLMRDGQIEGFRVQCKDGQADKRLTRAYQDFRSAGVYPPATVHMSSYNYDFYSDDDWVMNFSLTDIKGESIHDYDVDELSRKLREADAVMFFLNGYDIWSGKDVDGQIDDIYILLNNCFVEDDRDKLLMVIFSQMDRIGNGITGEDWETLRKTVGDLERMAKESKNINYVALPTACSLDCMMDLDYAMVLLMLFGQTSDLIKRVGAINAEMESIKKQYGEGFLRSAKEVVLEMFWKDKERREARKRAAALQVEYEKYQKMLEKFEKLRKFIDEYEVGTYYQLKRRKSSKNEKIFEL